MPHDPEQNVLRQVFISFVSFDIVNAEGASCKEEALALECRHSSGITQGLTGGQSQLGRSRCGVQIANESRLLCLDPPFRRRGQLLRSPELVRPLAKVIKGHRAVTSAHSARSALCEVSQTGRC